MFRWLVRAYAATGAPGSRVSEVEDWPLGDFIAGALDRPGAMAVLVGTPGPAQKATVQFWDRGGRVIGFVRLGGRGPVGDGAARLCGFLLACRALRLARVRGRAPASTAVDFGTLGQAEIFLIEP